MNFKEKELIVELFNKLRIKYPEISLRNIESGMEDPSDLWINIVAPMDEDREIEFGHYAAELTSDILDKYGYMFIVLPENPNLVYN